MKCRCWMTNFPDNRMHTILFFLSAWCGLGFSGNTGADGGFDPVFFRPVKAGQQIRCTARAEYLAEHSLSGSIESASTHLNNIQVELAGILTVIETLEGQPSALQLDIEKFSCLENGVKYQPGLDGQTICLLRASPKPVFAFKHSGNAVPAKDSAMLGMIFDLGMIEPAGKTIWGYPGRIHLGSSWLPDLKILKTQLQRLNFRPEKLEGKVTFQAKQLFQGTDCLLLSMDINCQLPGGETYSAVSRAAFPADNSIYGPVKSDLRILRKRQVKLPDNEPLTNGQAMQSAERFHLETLTTVIK